MAATADAGATPLLLSPGAQGLGARCQAHSVPGMWVLQDRQPLVPQGQACSLPVLWACTLLG